MRAGEKQINSPMGKVKILKNLSIIEGPVYDQCIQCKESIFQSRNEAVMRAVGFIPQLSAPEFSAVAERRLKARPRR
jgi:hypothetical protein